MESAVSASRPRIIYVVTEDWYFWSHRLDLARAVRDAGYDVTITTRVTDHGERIRQEGFTLAPLALIRRSRNPLQEWRTVAALVRLYRRVRPDVVHHVAMKPILYGSLAAWIVGVPIVINAFAGLGYTFAEERIKLLRWTIKWGFKTVVRLSRSFVLLQNQDDQERLVYEGIVSVGRAKVIAGSGIDTKMFSVQVPPAGVPVVVLPARMLWDKGVGEFVEAARHLKRKGINARFALVGRRDEHNPAAISESVLTTWAKEGAVERWGYRDDMPEVYQAASLVVLPSYREGLPKVLLEAAASGKAIVATNVPGCRDIVRHEVNGVLVPPHDWTALADGIERLLLNKVQREAMGARGRVLAEKKWSLPTIVGQTLLLYHEMLQPRPGERRASRPLSYKKAA
jgi:glycosyltransferase involved in cell wall biosynthesis